MDTPTSGYVIQWFDMVERRIFLSDSGMPTRDLHAARTFETKREAQAEIDRLRTFAPRVWTPSPLWRPMVAELDRVRQDMESVEREADRMFSNWPVKKGAA